VGFLLILSPCCFRAQLRLRAVFELQELASWSCPSLLVGREGPLYAGEPFALIKPEQSEKGLLQIVVATSKSAARAFRVFRVCS
jgi:hypothetical protein